MSHDCEETARRIACGESLDDEENVLGCARCAELLATRKELAAALTSAERPEPSPGFEARVAWGSRKAARMRRARLVIGAPLVAAAAMAAIFLVAHRPSAPSPARPAGGAASAGDSARDADLWAEVKALSDVDRALSIHADWDAIEGPLRVYGLLGEPGGNR